MARPGGERCRRSATHARGAHGTAKSARAHGHVQGHAQGQGQGQGTALLSPEWATPQYVLDLQRTAGNAAVQRWFGKKKEDKEGRTPFTAPDESKLKLYELAKGDIQKLVEKKERLVKEGMDPEMAEFQVYTHAPENLKQYLPLNTAFDRVKREVDRARAEFKGGKEGEIAFLMNERARKYGFTVGSGVAPDLKPKDVGKELAEKKADQRAFEKKATEVLFIKRRKAKNALEEAKKSNDADAIKTAQDEVAKLEGAEAVDAEILQLKLSLLAVIQERIGDAEAKYFLGQGPPPSVGKLWDKKKKIAEEVKNDFLMKPSDHLLRAQDASKVLKVVGMGAKPLAKQIVGVGETLGAGGAGSPFAQIVTGAGSALKGLTAAFNGIVKVISKAQDMKGGRYDKDTGKEIAEEVLNTTAKLAKSASKTVDAFTGPMGLLAGAAGAVEAVPALGIVANVLTMAASAVALVAPANRLATMWKAIQATTDIVLQSALTRTELENMLMVTTEGVTISAQMVMLVANITELATAGGMGIPAAVKLAARSAIYAKKVLDFKLKDAQAAATEKARKEGVQQKEGSGQKLIETDVAYAVDTIILKAKKKPPDPNAVKVLESYGMENIEVMRFPFDVIREKVFDKLDTDEQQQSVKTKAKEAVKDLKEKLGGDEKEGDYETIEEMLAKGPKEKKGALGKITGAIGKLPKKIKDTPKNIKEDLQEKHEKARRVREVKNLAGYRGVTDRGKGSTVKHFLKGEDDILKSEEHVREFIVDTVKDPMQKAALLDQLQTVEQKEKMAKKARVKREMEERQKEKVSDRVVTPWLMQAVERASLEELRDMIRNPGDMGQADLKLVMLEISKRQGTDKPDTFEVKERKGKEPSITEKLEAFTDRLADSKERAKMGQDVKAFGKKLTDAIPSLTQVGQGIQSGGKQLGSTIVNAPSSISKGVKTWLADKEEAKEKKERIEHVMELTGYDAIYHVSWKDDKKTKKAKRAAKKFTEDAGGWDTEESVRAWINVRIEDDGFKRQLFDHLLTDKERQELAGKKEEHDRKMLEGDLPQPQIVQYVQGKSNDELRRMLSNPMAKARLKPADLAFIGRMIQKQALDMGAVSPFMKNWVEGKTVDQLKRVLSSGDERLAQVTARDLEYMKARVYELEGVGA
jgi:hypothetical protein